MTLIRGKTIELWSEEIIVTFNKTQMGWLLKMYDRLDPIWPCIGTFYTLGKGTWLYNDESKELAAIRRAPTKPEWGKAGSYPVVRRKGQRR